MQWSLIRGIVQTHVLPTRSLAATHKSCGFQPGLTSIASRQWQSSPLGFRACFHDSCHTMEETSSKTAMLKQKPQRKFIDKRRHNENRRGNKITTRSTKPSQGSQDFKDQKTRLKFDLPSIKRSMPLPNPQDFTGMNKQTLLNPKGALTSLLSSNGSMKVSTAPQGHFICHLSCTLPDHDPFQVIGEGHKRELAVQAAHLHLLSLLLTSKAIEQLWGTKERIDPKLINEEKDAKSEVYAYAARFGLLPRISMVHESSGLVRATKLWKMNIALPEQDINVTAAAKVPHVAEVLAATKFKREAENFLASRNSKSMFLQDSMTLTLANSADFFLFYKEVEPRVRFDTTIKQEQKQWSAQVSLNGQPLGTSVSSRSKTKAEELAYLVGAVLLCQENPDLLSRFIKALRAGNGKYLPKVSSVFVHLDTATANIMEDTVSAAEYAGLPAEVQELDKDENHGHRNRGRRRPELSESEGKSRSTALLEGYNSYLTRPDLQQLRDTRQGLPMSQYSSKVLDIIDENQYSIIIGATGSGKTTQVPQILLDRAIFNNNGATCNVICTQPRRIAATSVARRVAAERAQNLQDNVGYHVRFDAKLPKPGGSILYCTTGILLQQLQHDPDSILDRVSHLVIDEVHERDMMIDFLLIIIKNAVKKRLSEGKSCPKVVLMSATMDAELFSEYFKNNSPEIGEINCPTLSVPGRTFPVKEEYLDSILETLKKQYESRKLSHMSNDKSTVAYLDHERKMALQNAPANDNKDEPQEGRIIDWKSKTVTSADGSIVTSTDAEDALVPTGLVATTIAHITSTTPDGAILIFLPGLEEILAVEKLLKERPLGVDFSDDTKYRTYMLHSSIRDGQSTVFDPVPDGCRKIILSTNIAETSITIPDVKFVVDTGKSRELRYDQVTRITKLQCTWVSKSNTKQRAGRAGRVQDGTYYALYNMSRQKSLRAVGLPELLRADLQETCLDVKAQSMDVPIREFLASAIEPPPPAAVETAVNNLIRLDALTSDEKLTALGRVLSLLPVHPSLSKMIVMGMIYQCLDPLIILGAAAHERQLFTRPLDAKREATESKLGFSRESRSDHFTLLNAFNELRDRREKFGFERTRQFAFDNFLHAGAFNTIASTCNQIQEILVNAGFIDTNDLLKTTYGGSHFNENSGDSELIKALIVGGLSPNLGLTFNSKLFRTPSEEKCLVHPSSTMADEFSFTNTKRSGGSSYGSPKMVAYSTLAKSADGNAHYVRDVTVIDPMTAALFGGQLHADRKTRDTLEMDGWLPFEVRGRGPGGARTLLEFRNAMQRMHTEAFRELSRREPLRQSEVRRVLIKGLQAVYGNRGKIEGRRQASALPATFGHGSQAPRSRFSFDKLDLDPTSSGRGFSAQRARFPFAN